MTSKERVLRAVEHKLADRTPITFDAEKEVYNMLCEKLNVQSQKELFDALNVDTWMVLPKNFIYPQAEIDKPIKKSIWGWQAKVEEYSGGTYDELFNSPLAESTNIADIKNYNWPTEDALDFRHFPAETETHKDRAILGVFTWGAYFLATHIRGMESLMMDFAMNHKYADYLINTISEKSLYFLEKMLQNYGDGIDIVFMADDYCSQQGPLFSPAAFKKFVVPYLIKIVDRVHKANKKFLLHVCGAVRPLLPMIIDSGVDMLEPIQVRAQGMQPEGLKNDFGNNICFYGGMDLQQVLCKGTTETVKKEAQRLINILGQNSGYVFGPGHTYIQIDAPFENIMTMYRTANEYRPHSE